MKKLVIGLISLAVLSVAGFVLLIIVLANSHRSGTEFSPDDFSTRHFTYRKIDSIDYVITGIEYTSDSYSSRPDLVVDKLIKPIVKAEKTWHLVSESPSRVPISHDCDARFLVEFLEMQTDRYENFWTVWNSDHPELAKEFWPVVAEMARDEMYLFIGDVMEFGMTSTTKDVDDFADQLQQLAAEAYLKSGSIDFENDDLVQAKASVKKSLKFRDSKEAKRLLTRIEVGSNKESVSN